MLGRVAEHIRLIGLVLSDGNGVGGVCVQCVNATLYGEREVFAAIDGQVDHTGIDANSFLCLVTDVYSGARGEGRQSFGGVAIGGTEYLRDERAQRTRDGARRRLRLLF